MSNLTEHFTFEEFGIAPEAPKRVKENALWLCRNILEPLRYACAAPLVITSGYRSPAKNKAVGGVPTSFHLYEDDKAAVDLRPRGYTDNDLVELFDWIRLKSRLPIDAVILEYKNGRPCVLHIQVRTKNQPRFRAMIGLTNGAGAYTHRVFTLPTAVSPTEFVMRSFQKGQTDG